MKKTSTKKSSTKSITHREYSKGKKTVNLSLPEIIKKIVDKESWIADEYIAPSIPHIPQKTLMCRFKSFLKTVIEEFNGFFRP